MPRKPRAATNEPHVSKADLALMIEEATVDAHDEDEQRSGFYAMVEDNLALPFETMLLGVPVVVEKLDLTESGEIVAVCKRGRVRQRVSILDLPLPSPPPVGAEWIAAYRHWLRGR